MEAEEPLEDGPLLPLERRRSPVPHGLQGLRVGRARSCLGKALQGLDDLRQCLVADARNGAKIVAGGVGEAAHAGEAGALERVRQGGAEAEPVGVRFIADKRGEEGVTLACGRRIRFDARLEQGAAQRQDLVALLVSQPR